MLMQGRDVVFLFLLTFSCFPTFGSGATLPQDEIDALQQIGRTLGKHGWDFSADPCSRERSWQDPSTTKAYENNVTCNCTYQGNTVCHVVSIVLKGQDLQGVLPPELAKLHYLQQIDLTRNYLNGTIPAEWGSIPLVNISLVGNRITGPIPKELWNISTLTKLELEANNMSFGESGPLLEGIEMLVNITKLLLSSNAFSGQLPTSLANLKSLKDLRINDNNFTGRMPGFIKNWTELEKLAILGSGLQGPIPSEISSLEKLTDLRISDINGTASPFPELSNMTKMKTLILRNCNLTGPIPGYIAKMKDLKTLDLSFNMLVGQLPPTLSKQKNTKYIYLTSNFLNGTVPVGLLNKGVNIDLSYNNFLPPSTDGQCQAVDINYFGSPPTVNNLSGVVPCLKNFTCRKSISSFHINCGGKEVTVTSEKVKKIFTKDDDPGRASIYFLGENWAFSNTGDFMDNDQEPDKYIYTKQNKSRLTMPNSDLYTSARISPLSLTIMDSVYGMGITQ